MPLTNPPFMPEKGKPAYHLRESTLEELEQHRRMIAAAESLRKNCSTPSSCDSVPAPSPKA